MIFFPTSRHLTPLSIWHWNLFLYEAFPFSTLDISSSSFLCSHLKINCINPFTCVFYIKYWGIHFKKQSCLLMIQCLSYNTLIAEWSVSTCWIEMCLDLFLELPRKKLISRSLHQSCRSLVFKTKLMQSRFHNQHLDFLNCLLYCALP